MKDVSVELTGYMRTDPTKDGKMELLRVAATEGLTTENTLNLLQTLQG